MRNYNNPSEDVKTGKEVRFEEMVDNWNRGLENGAHVWKEVRKKTQIGISDIRGKVTKDNSVVESNWVEKFKLYLNWKF